MRLIGSRKIEELRDKIGEKGLHAALFVNNEPVLDSNIAYISGFGGMLSGALLVSPEKLELITTELDYDRAQEHAHVDDIFKCKSGLELYQSIKDHCKKYRKIGVMKNLFTVEMAERTGMKLSSLDDISTVMERCRMVKEQKEIDAARQCAAICNKGVKFMEGFIQDGMKECELAAELERVLKITGSEYPPFETIVTSGIRSHFVHPSPPASTEAIENGLGIVDFGAVHNGYSTDITVPFTNGKLHERQQQIVDTVMAAWEDVRKKIKSGVKTSSLHGIYQKAVESAGFKIKHSLGHSVGMDVHEYPSLSGTEIELKAGMILAVEPGVYERNVGGCRLENTILVKKNGCELLTKSKLIRM